MTNFGRRGGKFRLCIPGPQIRSVETHARRRDMQTCSHDGARVGPAVDPFVAGQTIDVLRDQPVVRPPDQLHDRRKIRCRRDGVEQSNRPSGRNRDGISR